MTEFSEQVEEYVREDRLGPDNPDKPQSQYARNFWKAVLQRNED